MTNVEALVKQALSQPTQGRIMALRMECDAG